MPETYIQVLLPLKLQWIPTYSTHAGLTPGVRVCVELGGRRYEGVVWRSLERPDLPLERIQPVLSVLDELPRVSPGELRFWEFLSGYYLCTLGEVYKAAYPLLKLRSEQTAADSLARLRERLQKKEAALAGRHCPRVLERLSAERDALLAEIAARTPAAERGDSPITSANDGNKPANDEEGSANDEERSGHDGEKPEVLTGPDRHSAYLPALREALQRGRQALVLIPEIAFCDSLEALLRPEFGTQLQLFHSGRTPVQRRQVAQALRDGTPGIILGTRSALFLPFRSLDLVIVDEEQDPSYKQTEPAPRYQGRDAAIALAGIHGARVLLGTAVPSLETLYNLRIGKYVLAGSSTRHSPTPLRHSPTLIGEPPAAEVIDIPAERRKNGMVGSLSRKLLAAALQTAGPVLLIRGWEKAEVLQEEAAAALPGRDVRIKTLGALKREGADGAALIAVVQADALIARDDFRADERAAQLLGTLRLFAPRLVVQTAVPARFSGTRSLDDLLAERSQFGFPPYTRLVETRRQGSGEILRRHFLPRDRQLAARKAALAAELPAGCYLDVDPAD